MLQATSQPARKWGCIFYHFDLFQRLLKPAWKRFRMYPILLKSLLVVLLLGSTGCLSWWKRTTKQAPLPQVELPQPKTSQDFTSNPSGSMDNPVAMIPPPPAMDIPRWDSRAATTIVKGSSEDQNGYEIRAKEPEKVVQTGFDAGKVNPLREEPNTVSVGKEVHTLVQRASVRHEKLEAYETILTRREVVHGESRPEEVIQYRYRRTPKSIAMKWIGLEYQGRELLFSESPNAQVHLMTGRGEGLLIPAGKKTRLSPDDPRIQKNARYDFRFSALGRTIATMQAKLSRENADPQWQQKYRYIGPVSRVEQRQGLVGVEELIFPGEEPLLPQGGKRTILFDQLQGSDSIDFPVLIYAVDRNGREVEYYWFKNVKPRKFGDEDFDPIGLGRSK
ncbi:MAG: DUF1571 domain-containing protein [Zavarzinella sp.]